MREMDDYNGDWGVLDPYFTVCAALRFSALQWLIVLSFAVRGSVQDVVDNEAQIEASILAQRIAHL